MSETCVLELEHVAKSYHDSGEEVRAVDGVSLSVQAGEMIALHGPSGSGKTTLLLLIAGLLAPDRGTVRYQGKDLASLSDDALSSYLLRDVGFVFQSMQLMPQVPSLTNAAIKLLLDRVRLDPARARAGQWLERLGLGERLGHTPEQLSGGERQRVAIARALAGEPKLILADEPTGNLDSARSIEIVELLHSVAREQGASVILVTHDDEAATRADRHFTLRDGRLNDDGQKPAGERAAADPPENTAAVP
ncbi:MAG: ABC transporter ATP-binding protein [Solirubrobacteraceae bacterium]